MTLIPCRAQLANGHCGSIPTVNEQTLSGIHTVQIECRCGRHGAFVMFTKVADRERCIQAAADGWNSAD